MASHLPEKFKKFDTVPAALGPLTLPTARRRQISTTQASGRSRHFDPAPETALTLLTVATCCCVNGCKLARKYFYR
jgi:hypothetical protein